MGSLGGTEGDPLQPIRPGPIPQWLGPGLRSGSLSVPASSLPPPGHRRLPRLVGTQLPRTPLPFQPPPLRLKPGDLDR